MKILKFRGENVKRLKFVEITPDPDSSAVVLKGKNEQGKSSVLDAIWYALGGTSQIKGQPLREGEEKGFAEVDLGDFIIRRTFTPTSTSLRVRDSNGSTPGSQQSLLDRFMGKLSDPHALARMKPAEQRSVFIDLLGVQKDLDELDSQIAKITEERKMVNRDIRNAEGEYNSLPNGERGLKAVNVSDLIVNLQEAEEKQRSFKAHCDECDKQAEDNFRKKEEIDELEIRLEALKAEWKNGIKNLEDLLTKTKDFEDLEDIEAIREKIASADSINEQVRKAEAKRKALETLDTAKEVYASLGAKKASLEQARLDILANAEMPIAGLGISEDGITFDGLPIENASDAQRTLIYASIAMAMDPEIKILRISDGSLLDREHLDSLVQMAENKGFQLWIETVGLEGEGIIIEDGSVADPVLENVM